MTVDRHAAPLGDGQLAARGAHRRGDAAGDVQRGVQGLRVADGDHAVGRAERRGRRRRCGRRCPVNAVVVPTRTGPNWIASAPAPRSSSTTSSRSSPPSVPVRVGDGDDDARAGGRAACRAAPRAPAPPAAPAGGRRPSGCRSSAGWRRLACSWRDLRAQPVGPVVLVVEDADEVVLAQPGQRVGRAVGVHLHGDGEAEQQREHADDRRRGVPSGEQATMPTDRRARLPCSSAVSRRRRRRRRARRRELVVGHAHARNR